MSRQQMDKLLQLIYIIAVLKKPDSNEAVTLKNQLLDSCPNT